MGNYDKRGSYAGYQKNNKEREKLDYYATPTQEVYKFLCDNIGLHRDNSKDNPYRILEPCVGGGHMLKGIVQWAQEMGIYISVDCTDIMDRKPFKVAETNDYVVDINYKSEEDFLSDEYCFGDKKYDYIIMNPPFSTIEPFVMRALTMLRDGFGQLVLFARTQFLEGISRYNNIFKEDEPTYFYQYVERVTCAKNGNFLIKTPGIQSYAWFVWDRYFPMLHELSHIHRAGNLQ